MKKLSIALLAIVLFMSATLPVLAAEEMKTFTVDKLVTAMDKNGNEYCRFIAHEEKMLNGVKYTVGVPVMTFSGTTPQAFDTISKLSNGDSVKAIVQAKEYKGRTSYTVLAIVQ